MDNNIDSLLKDIQSDIPKVNPNLSTKIYEKALQKDSKSIFPFFKKPLIISFTTIIAVVIVLFGIVKLGGLTSSKNNFDDINNNIQGDHGNENNSDINNTPGSSEDIKPFIPNLSPSMQNTVFIDYHYTVYTPYKDVITLIINNKINYQKIYLKAYNLEIDDVTLNNGEVEIKEVMIENEVFFEIIFDNSNTSIHYIDLSFEKGTISSILEKQNNYKMLFIMYINEVDAEKGYGYEFSIDEVFDLSKGDFQ